MARARGSGPCRHIGGCETVSLEMDGSVNLSPKTSRGVLECDVVSTASHAWLCDNGRGVHQQLIDKGRCWCRTLCATSHDLMAGDGLALGCLGPCAVWPCPRPQTQLSVRTASGLSPASG